VIPDSFKHDLLNRVDIVEVVGRYVQLKKAGANFSGLCPFHSEKTPSFTVSPAKQFYHCFGCQKHGNAIGFLMDYGGMGYVDAIKELASAVGMQVPEWQPRTPEEAQRKERETDLVQVMEKAMQFYRAELKKSPRAIEYLKGRGLEGRVAGRFGIGYAPDDWQALRAAFPEYEDQALVECGLVIENEGKRYDRFRDRVMFPIFSARGAVIGFGGRVLGAGEPKYLNSPETPLFEKGRELYGFAQASDAIRAARRALVVEGYMDVVALAQFDIGYAVATLGTATTPVHVSKLLRVADEIVYCFDGDAAGRKAAWRALEVSLPLVPDHKRFGFLFLPHGEDPDTFIRSHGKPAFEELLADARPLSGFLIGELRGQADLSSPEGRAAFLSVAKPYIRQITAPALRLQILNEIADLGRISDQDLRDLVGEAKSQRASGPTSYRRSYAARNSAEWELLQNLLGNLGLVQHIDPDLLTADLPETKALLAIRDIVQAASEVPTFPFLVETLQGSPHMEVVLQAARYSSDLNLGAEEVRREIQEALAKLELARRKRELDAILSRGLVSTEERVEYQAKLTSYKRLQGALPSS
jgi:DNA primase